MHEYIEREKALDAILEWLMKALHTENMSSYNEGERAAYRTALSEIAELPAADVRPVVLCGDCKYWETDWTPRGVSDGRHYCAPLDLYPSADWFCADGEKKEEI